MTESAVKKMPKWESDTRERIRASLRKFGKPLAELAARDANEGDTRLLITDVLCDALGFDKYSDLTTEYAVKGEFADYGVRIDQQLVAFIEVKRATTKLNERHLRQVEMYAVNEGVEWLILTNGSQWQVYRLIAGLPVTIDLVIDIDLLAETPTLLRKADQLFYLSKESLKRRQIEEVWRERAATAPKSLAAIVLSDPVVEAARKELRRQTGLNLDAQEIARLIRDSVIDVGLRK